ncbi:hypothetical protein PAPYR_7936 [Paratrimastix pyriformis]|uniref:Uncharacterized protein n=1 Tax=Paratrimastix pyriformis TaxID=342808 RepID=A0ABQ8UE61_9EUKA|nr:hypothetical protein PAPYR_7936 [Paratrimastix pyriformis]
MPAFPRASSRPCPWGCQRAWWLVDLTVTRHENHAEAAARKAAHSEQLAAALAVATGQPCKVVPLVLALTGAIPVVKDGSLSDKIDKAPAHYQAEVRGRSRLHHLLHPRHPWTWWLVIIGAHEKVIVGIRFSMKPSRLYTPCTVLSGPSVTWVPQTRK